MARLMKITEFTTDSFGGPQKNKHVWMEVREGYYGRFGGLSTRILEDTYGGKPYPALISGCRYMRMVNGKKIVGQLKVDGGYTVWFNVFNDYGTGYNVVWRLWTSKPTEEQCKNTDWEE